MLSKENASARASLTPARPEVIYTFGPFRLDAVERTLLREGVGIALTPKAFDTLCVLVENSGHLLLKEKLLDAIWPETFVEEKTLVQNVFTLRKVLGVDDSGGPYIETVPKRGYRFTSAVTILPRPEVNGVGTDFSEPKIAEPEANGHRTVVVVGATDQDAGQVLPQELTTPATPLALRRLPLLNRRTVAVVTLVGVCAAVFLLVVFRGRIFPHRTPYENLHISKLTDSGNVGVMALSPDAKYVAHVVVESGRQSIQVRQIDGARGIEIVPPTNAFFLGITFSRDSSAVYYVSIQRSGLIATLYRVPVLGGTPLKIVADVDSPVTVSPDDKQVAFVRGVPDKHETQLVIATVADGKERILATRPDPRGFGLNGPSWSADGKLIATATANYAVDLNHDENVVVVNTATGAVDTLGSKIWGWLGQVAWTGNNLLVTGWDGDPALMSDQVWLLSYPSGQLRKLTNDVSGYDGISVSADSRTIAVTRSDSAGGFWVSTDGVPMNASQIMHGTWGRMGRLYGMNWTPDGRLVYASARTGTPEIWVGNSDGGEQHQVTVDRNLSTMPVMTPDGRHIVYLSRRGHERHVWRIDVDGSNAKQLTSTTGDDFPSITADGKWVLYSERETSSVWKVPIEGGTPVLVRHNAFGPAVSPDGEKLALFDILDDKSVGLTVLSIENGAVIRQYKDNRMGFPVVWTHDSKAVTFATEQDGIGNIWSLPISGGPAKQLTNWKSDRILRMAWSRDGRLACERATVIRDVLLLRDTGN
jgi:Tol biopolymer transport system component/DNA-binding winged helix-turn-helix (wHTH) protein